MIANSLACCSVGMRLVCELAVGGMDSKPGLPAALLSVRSGVGTSMH